MRWTSTTASHCGSITKRPVIHLRPGCWPLSQQRSVSSPLITSGCWTMSSLHHRAKWNPCHTAGQCQPCAVWSWRLNECFALASSVKGIWYTALSVHRSDGWRLCHAGEPQRGKNSCPWLPLPGWYGFAHVWGTGEAMCWSMRALCFQFVLTSPSPGVGHSLEKRTFLRFQVY